MALCFPFRSCLSGWFTKTDQTHTPYGFQRNDEGISEWYRRFMVNGGRTVSNRFTATNRSAGNGQAGSIGQRRTESTPNNDSLEARCRRMFQRKRKPKETDLDLPEPVDKLPEGVLKHWVPISRCCEEVLEEIRLKAPANSQVSLDKLETGEEEMERRKLLTRVRKLFVRQRTPQELAMKKLRKERKAVVKYLKGKNLYNRRMTFEHMKDLKIIVEKSFGEVGNDEDVQEIEMKDMKSSSEASPEPVKLSELESEDVQKAESTDDVVEPKSETKIWERPEGPMDETDGNQIHPGTGLPISAPIYIPGIFRTWPMEPIAVVKDNMLLHILPGDIPCIRCNPEAIVVNAAITEEPIEKQNGQDEQIQQPKEEQIIPPSPPPFEDGAPIDAILDNSKSTESNVNGEGIVLLTPTQNCTTRKSTEQIEHPSSFPSENKTEAQKLFSLPILENVLPFDPKIDVKELPPLPSPENFPIWSPTEKLEFPSLLPLENVKRWKTMIIPRSNIHEEAKLDEEMDPLKEDEITENAPGETEQPKTTEEPKLFEATSPLLEKQSYPWHQTITIFAEVHEPPKSHGEDDKQDATAEGMPPPLPPKRNKRRQRQYRTRINWADVDKIEVDPTYNQEEEERKHKKKIPGATSSQCDVAGNHTPLCNHSMGWTYDKPYYNERLVE